MSELCEYEFECRIPVNITDMNDKTVSHRWTTTTTTTSHQILSVSVSYSPKNRNAYASISFNTILNTHIYIGERIQLHSYYLYYCWAFVHIDTRHTHTQSHICTYHIMSCRIIQSDHMSWMEFVEAAAIRL